MTDNVEPPANEIQQLEAIGALNFTPESLVTVPERTDWHVIADHELDALSSPIGGIVGAIGFAALGGTLGAAPQAILAYLAISAGKPLSGDVATSMVIFLLCFATTLICLTVFGIHKYKNRNLTDKIKHRPKRRGGLA